MNGAIAEPWLKMINPPNIIKTINIGSSQYFFLTFINFQNSFKKSIIKIDLSYYFLIFVFQSNMMFCSFFLNLINFFPKVSLLKMWVLLL